MPKAESGGPSRFFSIYLASKILSKSFRKTKNLTNFNSHSPKKSEKRIFWDFLTFVQLQNIKQSERRTDPLGTIKNFRKSLIRKGGSLIVPKKGKPFALEYL